MDIVYGVFVFLFSACIASFMNVVIYRLPNKMSLFTPASHCPKCNHLIKWYDNIPLLSFIILRGKCRYCKEPISPRYFIVELLGGVVSTLIYIKFGLCANAIFGILLFLCLIPIAFIDIEHMEISDAMIITLLIIGIVGIFLNNLDYGSHLISVDWKSKLIAIGAVIVFSAFVIGLELLIKVDFLGIGDLKLFLVAGLFLGWQQLLLMLVFASISGSIFGIVKMLVEAVKNRDQEKPDFKHMESKPFPFGPFIAISTIVVYTFGIYIIEWWLMLLA